jgi:ATP-dependent RNA helicase RhlE
MNQRFVHLEHVKMLVLDEADRMLDMGFVHDVKKVIAKVPVKRQTLFFSATMPKEIQSLADSILTNPEKIEVTPVSSTADTIQQSLFYVDKNDKKSLLIHILKDKNIKTALVFTRTKHGADKVVKDLVRVGITAEAIHGNKSQNARQRALTNFKNRTTRVLIATDIAARGIDIDELTHVINYEIPNIPETYVHRIGRTGRAGASGIALSFCDEEEIEFLKDIHKLIAKEIPIEEAHPYPLSPVAIAAGMGAKKGSANANLRNGSSSGRSGGNRRQGGSGNRSGGGNSRAGGNRTGGNSGLSGASRSSGGNRH